MKRAGQDHQTQQLPHYYRINSPATSPATTQHFAVSTAVQHTHPHGDIQKADLNADNQDPDANIVTRADNHVCYIMGAKASSIHRVCAALYGEHNTRP
jgi:hypothetical protein